MIQRKEICKSAAAWNSYLFMPTLGTRDQKNIVFPSFLKDEWEGGAGADSIFLNHDADSNVRAIIEKQMFVQVGLFCTSIFFIRDIKISWFARWDNSWWWIFRSRSNILAAVHSASYFSFWVIVSEPISPRLLLGTSRRKFSRISPVANHLQSRADKV